MLKTQFLYYFLLSFSKAQKKKKIAKALYIQFSFFLAASQFSVVTNEEASEGKKIVENRLFDYTSSLSLEYL